jgi:hypothetical protein
VIEQMSFFDLRDELRKDPLDDDLWREWMRRLNDRMADRTPAYGERCGDYVWTQGDDPDANPRILLLDYWHYSPLTRTQLNPLDKMERAHAPDR